MPSVLGLWAFLGPPPAQPCAHSWLWVTRRVAGLHPRCCCVYQVYPVSSGHRKVPGLHVHVIKIGYSSFRDPARRLALSTLPDPGRGLGSTGRQPPHGLAPGAGELSRVPGGLSCHVNCAHSVPSALLPNPVTSPPSGPSPASGHSLLCHPHQAPARYLDACVPHVGLRFRGSCEGHLHEGPGVRLAQD